jgi:hypothetical protein
MNPLNAITYYCGDCQLWDPEDKSLGGSEQAIVQLSQQWIKLKYNVTVYANCHPKVINGVIYQRWEEFDKTKPNNILILWRISGVKGLGREKPKARVVLLDLHDFTQIHEIQYLHDYVHVYMLKSEYHASLYPFMEKKIRIVANGIQMTAYEIMGKKKLQREPLRFCYTASYDRGLFELLKWSWPKIHKELPESKLHVYYGYSKWDSNQNETKILMEQPGVVHYGRRPNHEVAEEKHRSSFNLYPSHSATEIDCINVRESALAGCIPILSNKYVFAERDGVHLMGDPKTKEFHDKYAILVTNLAREPQEKLEKMRSTLRSSETIFTWEPVAVQWHQIFRQELSRITNYLL